MGENLSLETSCSHSFNAKAQFMLHVTSNGIDPRQRRFAVTRARVSKMFAVSESYRVIVENWWFEIGNEKTKSFLERTNAREREREREEVCATSASGHFKATDRW